jgi:hypothetical protein
MKKTSKSIGHVILTVMALCLSGCYYDEVSERIPDDTIVSFKTDIQPIFTTNCTACHPSPVSSPDLTGDNSYNSITNGVYIVPNDAEASLLYRRLLGNPSVMPPSGSLPSSEIALLKTWIEQGALNN